MRPERAHGEDSRPDVGDLTRRRVVGGSIPSPGTAGGFERRIRSSCCPPDSDGMDPDGERLRVPDASSGKEYDLPFAFEYGRHGPNATA